MPKEVSSESIKPHEVMSPEKMLEQIRVFNKAIGGKENEI